MPLAKKKKTPKRNFQEQADSLFAAAVRAIGYCEHCGSPDNLQCAHVISRRYLSIRTDFRNAVCLCRKCHWYFTPRPIEWEIWIRGFITDQVYDELRERALSMVKVDWKLEVERLKTAVPEYRSGPGGN